MRELVNRGFTADMTLDLSAFPTDPAAWFAAQAPLGMDTWLLAYAEDGVIWGRVEDKELVLPPAHIPTLSPLTLLEARLFGENGEIHIWRTDAGFSACRITEHESEFGAFDEWQRLWGTESEKLTKKDKEQQEIKFTQLVDGQEGLRHAVPIAIPPHDFTTRHPRFHPALIQTRHYFQVDEKTGVTSIALSRLVSVKSESFDEYRKRANSYE